MVQKQAVTYVSFDPSEAPYCIENRTDALVRVQQKPVGPTYQVGARQTLPFAWDQAPIAPVPPMDDDINRHSGMRPLGMGSQLAA